MKRFRTLTTLTTTAAAAAAAGGLLLTGTAGAAQAATLTAAHPARQAVGIGSVELGSPLQYEQFLALQGFGHNHGYVDYTNWTYAEPGSGVWAPAQSTPGTTAPESLVFTYPANTGTAYAHTLNGGLVLKALSPDKLAFSGTGQYPATGTAQYTWKIRGLIRDGKIHAVISYDNSTYQLTLDGVIAGNGSASGTAVAVNPAQQLSWTMPAGAFTSVLHYVAPVQSDRIARHDATFSFTIPAGVSGLAGTKVTVKVHDGGWGAKHDSYDAGITGTTLTPYPIIGGPGITVRGR